jgi:hypothetical protein
MICGKAILVGEEDSSRMVSGRETEADYSGSDFLCAQTYTLDDFSLINPVATSTVLVRKEVLEQTGGFDEQFRGPEDYDLWLRVMAIAPVVRLEIPVLLYRHRQGSLSLDDRKFLPQVLKVLKKAYGKGGVFGHRRGRRRAIAYQWLCGAWSSAERGDMGRACFCFLRSLLYWPRPFGGAQNLRWARCKVGYYILRAAVRRRERGGVCPVVSKIL